MQKWANCIRHLEKINVLAAPETSLNFVIFSYLDMQPSISDTTKVLYVLRFRALHMQPSISDTSGRLSKIAKNLILFNNFGFPGLIKATKVAYVLHFPGLQRFGSRETAF